MQACQSPVQRQGNDLKSVMGNHKAMQADKSDWLWQQQQKPKK